MIHLELSAMQYAEHNNDHKNTNIVPEKAPLYTSDSPVAYLNPFKKLLSEHGKSFIIQDKQSHPPKYNIRIRTQDITYVDRNTDTKHIIVLNFKTGEITDNSEKKTPSFRDAFMKKLQAVSEDISNKKADVFEEV